MIIKRIMYTLAAPATSRAISRMRLSMVSKSVAKKVDPTIINVEAPLIMIIIT